VAGDWMALALERLQNTVRTVRLTLPPGRHDKFWARFLEIARFKQRGLSITILLPHDPRRNGALEAALKVLPDLERSGHEVGWSAGETLPYSLFVMDDLWALVVAGDPDAADGSGYWRLTDEPEETRRLRDAFDRRVARGSWGIDPEAWVAWMDQVPHRKVTRTALGQLHRGEKKLTRAINRAMKRLPRRGYWLMKPRDSAYGLAEPPGMLHWGQWVTRGQAAIGWPEWAEEFYGKGKLPKRSDFLQKMQKRHPGHRDLDRAYATARTFIDTMRPGDRIAAIDGWTSQQTSPVRVHGWGRIDGPPELEHDGAKWPLVRPAHWNRIEVDIPIEAVRTVTGLAGCTYPIHKLAGPPFSRLIDLAEEVRRTVAESQITLDLNIIGRINGQTELL